MCFSVLHKLPVCCGAVGCLDCFPEEAYFQEHLFDCFAVLQIDNKIGFIS